MDRTAIALIALFFVFGCIQPSQKCGDGICGPIEQQNPGICPQDCANQPNATSITSMPYYFIAIHNEPVHHAGGEAMLARDYETLKKMIERANEYNIKLTLMFTAQWAEYISESPERMADLEEWKKQGHEIAAHHHSIYHGNWDGYTDYSQEEAEAQRISQNCTPEEYLGTLDDYMAALKKINPNIKSGCVNDEPDKNEMPDGIIYDTCSGYANRGEVGRRGAVMNPEEMGKNEYVSVGVWKNITRKWLTHFQITTAEREGKAEKLFLTLNSSQVYGAVTHSVMGEQEAQFYEFLEFLHSKDPNAEKSRTVAEIIEQKLLPEKNLSPALVSAKYPVFASCSQYTGAPANQSEKCGDEICDSFEKANPNLCPKDCQEEIPQITQQELERGWYWGSKDQKKPGTPDDWMHALEGTRSACWHKPEVRCQ